MISHHDETQAHLYGLCDCPRVDEPRLTATEIARIEQASDAEIDAIDSEDNLTRRPRRTSGLTAAEVNRRRQARRRF